MEQFVPEKMLSYFEILSPYSRAHEKDWYGKSAVKISLCAEDALCQCADADAL